MNNYSIIIFILLKTVYCQKYCAVGADNSIGLSIYKPKCEERHCGKDDTFVSLSSNYALPTKELHFKSMSNGWVATNSLEKSIVDNPVLDERWESFMNNHDEIPRDFENVLNTGRNFGVFFSVRGHGGYNSTELTELKWYHLKSNTSGIYSYVCKNYSCETLLKSNLSILDYYNKSARNIWKIHKYDYLYTTNETTEEVIYSNEGNCSIHSRCFFVYLAMCKNCSMTLKILLKKYNRNYSFPDYKVQGEGKWIRTNYCVEDFPNCYNIHLQTHIQNSFENGFWAIGPKGYAIGHPSENCSSFVRLIQIPEDSYLCQDSLNQNITVSDTYFKKCSTNNMSKVQELNIVDTTFELAAYSWYFIGILPTILLLTVLFLFIFVCYKKKNRTSQSDRQQLLKNNKVEDNYYSVKRIDFPKYVQQECDTNYTRLQAQFSSIPSGYLYVCNDGKAKENVVKNRFPDIVPYDDNRVKLKKMIGGKYFKGDYINASYVHGSSNYREYIIAQNPQTNTINDFWLMIWQEKISYCVMITSEHEEYVRYWPTLSEKCVIWADLQIRLEEVQNYTCFQENKLLVSRKNESREVFLLHYYFWQDHNLDSCRSRILSFINRLQTIPHHCAPVLFHCLDGTGRSGTVVLCDIVLRSLPITGIIDIYHVTVTLIKSRINAIHDLQQYILAHLIIRDFLNKY